MNPNLTQGDHNAVAEFFRKMDSDMKEADDMIRTEINLIKAAKEYEQVWKVKIQFKNVSS